MMPLRDLSKTWNDNFFFKIVNNVRYYNVVMKRLPPVIAANDL